MKVQRLRASIGAVAWGLGLFILLIGAPVEYAMGKYSQYVAFVVASTPFALLGVTSKRGFVFWAYCLATAIIYLAQWQIPGKIIYSQALITYSLIPLLYGAPVLSAEDYGRVFHWLRFIIVPVFLGLVAQWMGVTSPLLLEDHAMTGDVFHERYSSFLGGVLALGLVSTICLFAVADRISKRSLNVVDLSLAALAIVSMLFSYSRRWIIVAVLALMLTYLGKWFQRKWYSATFFLLLSGYVFFGVMPSYSEEASLLVERVVSTFDFEEDDANQGRIMRWLESIDMIKGYPYLGTGLGSTGHLSYNEDRRLLVTESYILKEFVEGGVLFGILCLALHVYIFVQSIWAARKDERMLLPAAIAVAITIDLVMGGSLDSLLGAVLYWSSAAILIRPKRRMKSNLAVSSTYGRSVPSANLVCLSTSEI